MTLSALLLTIILGAACSTPIFRRPSPETTQGSTVNDKLLSNARRLGNNGDGSSQDFSWMSGYTMKFQRCVATTNCNADKCEALVQFKLCPADASCKAGCYGGTDYVVELPLFLDAFTEAQLDAQAYACEMARKDCGDNDNCYASYGLDYCGEEQGQVNLQKYLECKQYGNGSHYIKPYCSSDGRNIYLGVFTDYKCSKQASKGTFYSMYGFRLDYSDQSIVSNKCADCTEHASSKHQTQNDQTDADDVLEQCEDLYTNSKGCDQSSSSQNSGSDACNYASTETSSEEDSSSSSSSSSSSQQTSTQTYNTNTNTNSNSNSNTNKRNNNNKQKNKKQHQNIESGGQPVDFVLRRLLILAFFMGVSTIMCLWYFVMKRASQKIKAPLLEPYLVLMD